MQPTRRDGEKGTNRASEMRKLATRGVPAAWSIRKLTKRTRAPNSQQKLVLRARCATAEYRVFREARPDRVGEAHCFPRLAPKLRRRGSKRLPVARVSPSRLPAGCDEETLGCVKAFCGSSRLLRSYLIASFASRCSQ